MLLRHSEKAALIALFLVCGTGSGFAAPDDATPATTPADGKQKALSQPPANDHGLEMVVVTGMRLAQRINDSSKPITFIDRSQIDELNPSSVFDILQTVPGLSIARSGGIEGQISLRGLNSNYYHSPLFIDGDRFKGRNTLEYLLLEPEDISRVEVIRGPAAEAYGSEAVGGVVLISSFHATPESGDFHYTGGGFSLGYASVNDEMQGHEDLEFAGDNLGLRLSVSGRDAGNYQTPDGVAHNSDYKTGNFGADLVYALDDSQKLEFSAREISLDAGRAGGIGGAPGYPYVRQRDVLQAQTARVAYNGDYGDGLFRHVDADLFFDHFFGKIPSINTATPGTVSENISYVVGPTLVGGNLLGVIPWQDGNTTLGIDFFDEMRPDGSQSYSQTTKLNSAGQVTSVTIKPRTQTTPGDNQANEGLFADNVWNPSHDWTVTLGARMDVFQTVTGTSPVLSPVLQPLYADNASRTNVAGTGSLGVIYHWSPSLDLVGNVGNVFRMPSDTELFSTSVQGTGFALPNPALKPEQGDAVEGGFRLHRDGLTADVTAYYDLYRNFVETVPVIFDGESSTQPQNVQRVELKGVEGDFDARLMPTVFLYGNFTYTRATDLLADLPLAYIAPFNGITGLRYAPENGNYTLHVAVDWAAAKTRINPAQEYPTGSYGVIDIGGEISLDPYVGPGMKNTVIVATINNLLDAAYRSGATYANMAYPVSMTNPLLEPGRNFTITLRHRF